MEGGPVIDVLFVLAVFTAWAHLTWQLGAVPPGQAIGALRRLLGQVGSRARGVCTATAHLLGMPDEDAGLVGLGEVTEMIDVVRLGLSAGLSFDASLEMYCAERAGPLSREMGRARIFWQTGLASREEALMAAARRTGVRALEPFATATGQALALGAPLADTLGGQARECRAAHRADVERQIERAPVKLLIPTGTLILPALLLSILGPLLAAGGMI